MSSSSEKDETENTTKKDYIRRRKFLAAIHKPKFKKKLENTLVNVGIKPRVIVNKNKYGNYEHAESKLVFNTTGRIFGVQLPDGKVADLNTRSFIGYEYLMKFILLNKQGRALLKEIKNGPTLIEEVEEI
jgi:hypothetical protein